MNCFTSSGKGDKNNAGSELDASVSLPNNPLTAQLQGLKQRSVQLKEACQAAGKNTTRSEDLDDTASTTMILMNAVKRLEIRYDELKHTLKKKAVSDKDEMDKDSMLLGRHRLALNEGEKAMDKEIADNIKACIMQGYMPALLVHVDEAEDWVPPA